MNCEFMCKWHRNPVNCILHLIAFVVAIYGLWNHNWAWIIAAIIIAVIGHIIQALTKQPEKKAEKKKR